MNKSIEQIAAENDLFRSCELPSAEQFKMGRTVMTEIVSKPLEKSFLVQKLVQKFNAFNEVDNDPWGEHDFGKITLHGTDYFFKIDYFKNSDCEEGANPSFENVYRVMTIMEASEY